MNRRRHKWVKIDCLERFPVYPKAVNKAEQIGPFYKPGALNYMIYSDLNLRHAQQMANFWQHYGYTLVVSVIER